MIRLDSLPHRSRVEPSPDHPSGGFPLGEIGHHRLSVGASIRSTRISISCCRLSPNYRSFVDRPYAFTARTGVAASRTRGAAQSNVQLGRRTDGRGR